MQYPVTVHWTFTDREGGASAPPFAAFNLGSHVGDDPASVAANRSALRTRHQLDGIAWMDQVHSATVTVVTGIPDAAVPATDGLVTRIPGLALAVLVADCVPILARDGVGGVVGVAHAGRLGAAAGIGLRLLETMESEGADRRRVEVVLGPAVCGRCYEVPPAMQADVKRQLPGSAVETSWGTSGLDLRAGLASQLRAAGVAAVELSPRCTREDPRLFSHRREAPTGRQAGLVWIAS